jgi:hypothetical protein
MVVDGITGILIPKQDVEALIQAVLEVTRDRHRWYNMAAAALARFNERFTTIQSNRFLCDALLRAVAEESEA